MRNDDRTVHAVTAEGSEAVRYDRAGKWYIERPEYGQLALINLELAVAMAARPGSTIYFKRPGGRRFDAAVRKALARKEAA